MKNLTRLLTTGALCTSLAFSSLYNNGCSVMENMSEAEMVAALGTAIAATGKTDEKVAQGLVLKAIGDNQVAKEVAREGKTEITLNVNPQQGYQNQPQIPPVAQDPRFIPEYNMEELREQCTIGTVHRYQFFWSTEEESQYGLHALFTHNRYLDLNGDGRKELNEFNVKRNFRKGEPVNIEVVFNSKAHFAKNTSIRDFFTTKWEPTNVLIETIVQNEEGKVIYSNQIKKVFKEYQSPSLKHYANFNLGKDLIPGIYNITSTFSHDAPPKEMFMNHMKTRVGGVFQVLE